MFKAVFRPTELVALTDRLVINSPTSYPDLAHLAPVEEPEEIMDDIEEYTGPTADDLRREAEMFKAHWEEEKQQMVNSARMEAERIVMAARSDAEREIQLKNGELELLKQQAEQDAQKIITEAQAKAAELEKETRQSLEGERKEARESGFDEGQKAGYAAGKIEVDRLIERTQVMLERAQNKRGEILAETEKEIIDLVLLIARKIIKVISENQRNVIIANVVQALRKIKSKGNITIRVNMNDLQLTTEHKQEFIKLVEGVKSIQIVEDTTVDNGGCIIETDFGEIDARIASQLAELENKILEISPIKSKIKANTPPPVIRTANLNADLAATSSLMNIPPEEPYQKAEDDNELSQGVNAALTASAALAAIATMATKGKRDSDKQVAEKLESLGKRGTD
jgi:flagellar assembly protein FliH